MASTPPLPTTPGAPAGSSGAREWRSPGSRTPVLRLSLRNWWLRRRRERYTRPASSRLQVCLPFFRHFFFAWCDCCLRLQPFSTARRQHRWGLSPDLQLMPIEKHRPLATSQNGATSVHCASLVQPLGGRNITLPAPAPPPPHGGRTVPPSPPS